MNGNSQPRDSMPPTLISSTDRSDAHISACSLPCASKGLTRSPALPIEKGGRRRGMQGFTVS